MRHDLTFLLTMGIMAEYFTRTDVGQVCGYSSGAPTTACIGLLPDHGAAVSADPCPFKVNVSKTTYYPGETITVTLYSSTVSTFRGFIVQARAKYPADDEVSPRGRWVTDDVLAQQMNCSAVEDSVTHKFHSNGTLFDKRKLELTWKSPTDNSCDSYFIEMRASFVRIKADIWTFITSPPLSCTSSPLPQTSTSLVDSVSTANTPSESSFQVATSLSTSRKADNSSSKIILSTPTPTVVVEVESTSSFWTVVSSESVVQTTDPGTDHVQPERVTTFIPSQTDDTSSVVSSSSIATFSSLQPISATSALGSYNYMTSQAVETKSLSPQISVNSVSESTDVLSPSSSVFFSYELPSSTTSAAPGSSTSSRSDDNVSQEQKVEEIESLQTGEHELSQKQVQEIILWFLLGLYLTFTIAMKVVRQKLADDNLVLRRNASAMQLLRSNSISPTDVEVTSTTSSKVW